jgi:gamma-gliadin, putative
VNKLKQTTLLGISLLTLGQLATASVVFAEDNPRPATELTAGKESDKDKQVSKNDQALVDNSKSETKADKETTVLQKEEQPKKEEPKKEEPKKEEPKVEPKKEEKLPEAGFENIGLGVIGVSVIGAGVTAFARRKANK